MNLSMLSEIYKLLKPCVESGDTALAAETLVNYLVDEGFSPEEIKNAFRDKDIRSALEFYLESPPGELVEAERGYHEDDDEDEDEDYAAIC